jgi:hypothetical protein
MGGRNSARQIHRNNLMLFKKIVAINTDHIYAFSARQNNNKINIRS